MFAQSVQKLIASGQSVKTEQLGEFKFLAQDPTLNLYSLEGGIIAWKEGGFNIKRSGSNILSS